jgi:hypothetical protein
VRGATRSEAGRSPLGDQCNPLWGSIDGGLVARTWLSEQRGPQRSEDRRSERKRAFLVLLGKFPDILHKKQALELSAHAAVGLFGLAGLLCSPLGLLLRLLLPLQCQGLPAGLLKGQFNFGHVTG